MLARPPDFTPPPDSLPPEMKSSRWYWQMNTHPLSLIWRFALIVVFVLSLLVLGNGLSEPTGLTGKDEFYLSLRTSMEITEQDRWLFPSLDGEPRIKKPPLLYWLGALSYQIFGVSLISARLVSLFFAALFVLVATGLASQLGGRRRDGFLAGLLMLGMLGVVTEGRRFMLDLPAATCSALAFWAFVYWLRQSVTAARHPDHPDAPRLPDTFLQFLRGYRKRHGPLWLGAIALALGFLIKGPTVLVLFGSGVLALALARLVLPPDTRGALQNDELILRPDEDGVFGVPPPSAQSLPLLSLSWWREHVGTMLIAALLFMVLALPWFIAVRELYPQVYAAAWQDEMADRQLLVFSPKAFLGFLEIAMPWSFVVLVLAWRQWRAPGLPRFLLLWLFLSVLPFCFFRSFGRYLVGSLLPASLFLAISLPVTLRAAGLNGDQWLCWATRAGMYLGLALGGGMALFLYWFGLGGWYWMLLPLAYLFYAWQKPGQAGGRARLTHTIAAPIVYWMALLAWGYPALQVNAVPPEVLNLAQARRIVFYDGPQPGMLPVLHGRALRHYPRLKPEVARKLATRQTLIFTETAFVPRLQREARAAGLEAVQLGAYDALVSHGSGLRIARRGATRADWWRAIQSRDLRPLQTTVTWFKLVPPVS